MNYITLTNRFGKSYDFVYKKYGTEIVYAIYKVERPAAKIFRGRRITPFRGCVTPENSCNIGELFKEMYGDLFLL